MIGLALILHVFSAVIWVGGMFFAYLVLRPAAGGLPERSLVELWTGVFRLFFPWVWAAIAVLLLTGFYMASAVFNGLGHAPIYIHLMLGLGILMMLLFLHVYFAPWKRLQRHAQAGELENAQKQLRQIRVLIGINLLLGLIVVAIATGGALLF